MDKSSEREDIEPQGRGSTAQVSNLMAMGTVVGENYAPMPTKTLSQDIEQNVIRVLQSMLLQRNDIGCDENGEVFQIPATLSVCDTWGGARSVDLMCDIPLWCDDEEPEFTVRFISPIPEDTLSLACIQPYMMDALNVHTRALASAISGRLQLGHVLCANLATYALDTRERCDMSGLYAKGWALMLQREVIQNFLQHNAGYPIAWNPVDHNFHVRHWGQEDIVTVFAEDIMNRRIVVLARDFTARQINCLRHLAREGISMPPAERFNRPRINKARWGGIPIAVYYEAAPGAAAIADFTSGDMQSTLLQLVATRGDQAAYCRGFVKSTAINFQIRREQRNCSRWWLCTAERAGVISWAAPRDYNVIWRWLCVVPPPKGSDYMLKDSAVLSAMQPSEALRIGGMLASLLSTGMGLALQSYNIGGFELNDIAGQPGARAGGLQRIGQQLFWANVMRTRTPMIFQIAMAEIAAVSRIVISPSAFRQEAWSNGFVAIGPVAPDTQWGGWFGWRIPYVLDALVSSLCFDKWPRKWGLATHGVQLSVRKCVVTNGPGAGWYSDMVETEYHKISNEGGSCVPWRFIDYGPFVFNVFLQHFGIEVIPPLRYRRWGRSYNRPAVPLGVVEGPLIVGDDVVDFIHILRPGVFKSYSWNDDEVWAPFLLAGDLGDEWSRVRADQLSRLDNVGVLLPTIGVAVGGDLGAFDITLGLSVSREEDTDVPAAKRSHKDKGNE